MDKAESKYNPDAGISKEDEERYQKLLCENEDLQRLIVQVSFLLLSSFCYIWTSCPLRTFRFFFYFLLKKRFYFITHARVVDALQKAIQKAIKILYFLFCSVFPFITIEFMPCLYILYKGICFIYYNNVGVPHVYTSDCVPIVGSYKMYTHNIRRKADEGRVVSLW